jgi:hypothetical protein
MYPAYWAIYRNAGGGGEGRGSWNETLNNFLNMRNAYCASSVQATETSK